VKLCSVFRYTSGIYKHKKIILSYRMGKKLSFKSCLYLHQNQILMDFTDLYF